jgi:hypothetical protein
MRFSRILALVALALMALLISGCGSSQPAATVYAHVAQVDAEHAVADVHRHDKSGAAWWAKRSENWLERSTSAATRSKGKGKGGILSTIENVGSVGLEIARVWSILKYVLLLVAA